jgi:hypothetical protein
VEQSVAPVTATASSPSQARPIAIQIVRGAGFTVALLALIPGALYGVGWALLGGDVDGDFWTHLLLRAVGVILATAACNAAWRLVRGTAVWRAYAGYAACIGLMLAVAWATLLR